MHMTLGGLFITLVIIVGIVFLCGGAWWAVTKSKAPEWLVNVAEVAIVILGAAAIVFVVLPRLGVPV